MLDARSLAQRKGEIRESCRRRGIATDVDAVVELHAAVAAKQTEVNETNRRRNEHQQAGRKLSGEEREEHLAEGRALKEAVFRLDKELAELRTRFEQKLYELPNFIHAETPSGGEEDARELRRFGPEPRSDFPVRDHLELASALDLVDFEAGARVAGQKWYYLKNEAVLLELALQRYALDILLDEGFTPYVTPDLARPAILNGLGYNPRGEETQIYSVADADLCLVGTAEITLGGIYADSILEEAELPLKLAGISHCFRTEAGAAGRESKGLYRVHQFTKTEMFCITRPEDSDAMHAYLLGVEERLFQGLELPCRVVDIAAGDLGAPAYRKFDIEAWMPGRGEQGAYGELSSASNCTDYQARRLMVRFRRENSRKNEFVHMLNGTALANARTILALLENHQRKDGGIDIPKALQPYLGLDLISARRAARGGGPS